MNLKLNVSALEKQLRMKKYNLINNIFGWLSFVIAATTYLLTIEPSASFWDCGEFITSSYKLEVGHPPGAPFFMLTAKFFSLFASDLSQVAASINALSAIMSALTILFLFWTITHLAKKLIYSDASKEMSLGQMIVIIGSGLVGALTYTFSDTFWFSAVEAEVYAYSSMFTALVFWLILKWESRAHEEGSDKWLVIIAYTMGLSIGVHLLNLLCIPAIVLVYYFKKKEDATVKGMLGALAVSFGLIVILMYGIIPGFTKVGGWFELLFVNMFGLSYNSGAMTYILLIVATIIWGLFETMSKKGTLGRAKIAFATCMALSGVVFIGDSILLWLVLIGGLVAFTFVFKKIDFRFLNTALLCLMVILVGYSSFALIPIRSMANTPMDQNSPEDVFTLASYLNREQYGDRPLFHGKTYASREVRVNGQLQAPISEKEVYAKTVKIDPKQEDQYGISHSVPTYEQTNTMLFPRMYSKEQRHMIGYQMWGNVDMNKTSEAPTMMQNLQFFFTYQLDYMYFRYFMWNFSGRQNDIQGDGGISKGNWITGIGFIDEVLGRGPQDNLPPDMADNKGHNTYYALPFILGILGILFQIMQRRKGEQQFLVTFMLFFMTGIAIILYLNQQPFEPRERDYAYAGSFYAFSIWIGLGVAFLWNLLKKVLPETPAAAIVSVAALCIPIHMAAENWDDHDRSDRYIMRDFAKNYLDTCEPNAIIFTMGDNDTFPLWYMQEVEGYRTDVRVCNLSYLQTDWYVDQMRRQAYDSEPLPITWEESSYTGSRGAGAHLISRKELETAVLGSISDGNVKGLSSMVDFSKYFDTAAFKDEMQLADALDILKNNAEYVPSNPFVQSGMVIPSKTFTMPIDTANIDWAKFNSSPQADFKINLESQGAIYRQEMMVMEMLKNINETNWKRPIYYATTIGAAPLGLDSQSLLVGINSRIYPGKVDSTGVNVDLMFDNLVNKYQWGGVDNPKVYLDETNLKMVRSFRLMFTYLVDALIKKGDNERAIQALDKCISAIPGNTVPRGRESLMYARSYIALDQVEKGESVVNEILERADGSLQWYARLSQKDMIFNSADIRELMDIKLSVLTMYQHYDKAKYKEQSEEIQKYMNIFLANRVVFSNRSHPLDMMLQVAIYEYQQEKDSAKKESLMGEANKVVELMKRYNPDLLQKY